MNPALIHQFEMKHRMIMEPDIPNSKETIHGGSSAHNNGSPNQQFFRFGASAMRGHRPTMEDAHICQPIIPDLSHHAIFCVLDGHGGSEAAQFVSEELLRVLCDTRQWQIYAQRIRPHLKKGEAPPNARRIKEFDMLLEEALTLAFCEMDRELYLNHHYGEERGASSAGSTAVATLLTPFSIVCANIGDSRCVLASSSTATPQSTSPIPLSQDHKPHLPQEEERIVKAGGQVIIARVDGELAVSRAFGDFELKDVQGLQVDDNDYDPSDEDDVEQLLERASKQKVSAFPEIQIHARNDLTDRFLILACDGIFDVASNEDCVEWITTLLQQQQQQQQQRQQKDSDGDDLGLVCEQILDKCLQLGSEDNMTIIIVLLEAGLKLIGNSSSSSSNNNNKAKSAPKNNSSKKK